MCRSALRKPQRAPRRTGKRVSDAGDRSSRSTTSVRITRCGAPSIAVVTTVSSTRGREVARLHVVGHAALLREQEAGAHGDAVGAVGQRGDEPAAVVEAAGAEHRDLRRRRRRRPAAAAARSAPCRCGRRPRRPGRSRRRRPTRASSRRGGGRRRWASPARRRRGSRAMASFVGAPAKRHEPHALARRRTRCARRGRAGRPGSSRRRAGRCAPSPRRTAVRSSSAVIVTAARMPKPAGRARGRGQAGARHPSHAGLHDRVPHAGQLAEAGRQRIRT